MYMYFDDAVESLRKGVVRVVFRKKTADKFREMWCTRNYELITSRSGLVKAGSLKEDRENMDKQKRNHNVTVFDLQRNDFRTVPLDNILDVVNFGPVNTDGWIEFEIDEPWEEIINGERDLYRYLGLSKY